jgi:hypothetical protein
MLTAQSYKVVCIYDPAIDHKKISADVMRDYATNREYKTIEPYIRLGQKPVIYHLKRISRSIFLREIMPISNENERAIMAFKHALQLVENMENDQGVRLDYKPEGVLQTVDGERTVVSDAELERFAPCDVIEIGNVAWYHSFLRPGIRGSYRVPPTSLALLASLETQSVVANQTDAAPNNSGHSAQESVQSKTTEPTSAPEENKSGQHTVATVEVQG